MKRAPLILLFLCCAVSVHAQLENVYDVRVTSRGPLTIQQTNYGAVGYYRSEASSVFTYPNRRSSYIMGSGLWLTALVYDSTGVLVPSVLKLFNPNSGQSWTIPGHLGDGTDPRPDLRDEYVVKDSLVNGAQVLSSEFHSGYDGAYEGGRRREKGIRSLQFQQQLFTWPTGPMEGVAVVRTVVQNLGDEALMDVRYSSLVDVDIYGAERNGPFVNDNNAHFVVTQDSIGIGYSWKTPDPANASPQGVIGTFVLGEGPARYTDAVHLVPLTIEAFELSAYDRARLRRFDTTDQQRNVRHMITTSSLSEFKPGSFHTVYNVYMIMSGELAKPHLESGDHGPIREYLIAKSSEVLDTISKINERLKVSPEENDDIMVYPQPSQGSFTIDIGDTGEMGIWTTELIDLNGRTVYSAMHDYQEPLTLSNILPSGVYVVVLTQGVNRRSTMLSVVR